jgi:lipoyl(octanoyl) transferase
MQDYTNQRTTKTPSELWIVEHPPVYTQGQAGKPEHLLNPHNIPVIQTDRGGQITYHGPGQIVMYILISLREAGLGVRALINAMENSLIALLSRHGVTAEARPQAPGVYVKEAKIAALGLRVRRGYTFHGLSLNVAMDLSPFTHINPCGYPGMAVTQTTDQGITTDQITLAQQLADILSKHIGYIATNAIGDKARDEG